MCTCEDAHGIQVVLEVFHEIGCLADGTGHVFETGGELCVEPVLGLGGT